MSDVTLQNFEAEVIEASRHAPVLVDFWAPWCGPCRTLGPMLEKLEAEADGGWKLVKVNVDENQELAAHFGVRSIPHVVAFADAQAVDQFTGVLPESGLREFLARLAPEAGPATGLPPLETARELAAAGDRTGAEATYRRLLDDAAATASDGAGAASVDALRLEYAGFLLDGNDIGAAEAELGQVSTLATQGTVHAALRTRIDAMRAVSDLPPEAELAARIGADPRDTAARRDLARVLIARADYEAALAQLLEIVRTDRSFEDEVGRKTMISVFDMMGDPDAVLRWRRKLSSALN